ncbi:hypothetical protein B0H17DRAFT_593437 [Mycena rosella]|uniref:F-box domain-containing protein n=1 Tax=Mycena rosella TaxID=1033263 RepID=A0AAD7DFI9_MYCRO|nr:hypothetical protein B0H17DRAFT_593437 [Mycena rosella]
MKHLSSKPRAPPDRQARRCSIPLFQRPLPTEILLDVAGFLQNVELLNLSLTSSQLRRLLLPELYKTVSLDSSRACLSGLAMLAAHPELCAYVRTLTVRPNYAIVCWPRSDRPVNESTIAAMIEGLADKLVNLVKFTWGGVDLPPDSLWRAIRHACPQLRKIYSTAGSRHLDPESELLKFEDLTAFSLCFVARDEDLVRLGLPTQLWTMLMERCPNLEELTLRLFCSSHSLRDMDKLTSHVFPHLRALQLEIWFYNRDPSFSQPSVELLGPFLSAHPNIAELSIFPYTSDPERPIPNTLPLFLAPAALSRLRAFVGVYQHIAELPDSAALETLDLTGDPVSVVSVKAVGAALRRLSALRSLDVRLADVQDGLFQSIISACSGLITLRVMFPVNFGMKTLRKLSTALQRLPHLRSFTLYKGHRFTDGTMLRCALAILSDNPRLHEIQVAWFAWERCERRQNGSYFVLVDTGGRRYLDVWERGVRSVRVGGGVFDRRFRYMLEGRDLRGSVAKGLARIRR